MTHPQPIQVLLVEDNPADADLTRETLETSKLHIELSVARDGVEALDHLRRAPGYDGMPRPDLILLDLNLPRMDGRQLLAEIRADDALQSIPVVVLTSSEAERDIAESYRLGANCYVIKPVDLKAFQTIVEAVEGFWFTVVKLPP
ncbi:response regulator [Methylobrevis pamukkalensis]|uniref:Response regulator rcp1 n=1 Tax=Methylobrevis pamukkalensis TaxID=1439726 RepID=A0A1E3H099_9HYPH|nr:response regulator [Methylobrevis pamukkalensis]ODN69768.1 Response regulator rcp1 [Methylobrevis pamukkalensis]